jgi:predicted DNA-binding transcriptional regulator YafY
MSERWVKFATVGTMYHPTARLLTVLELLQARGQLSGAELAQRLEVDGRSVRRYVGMLQDMGIPIEGTRGPHGGYRLRPGYKLPPLLFSDDEAIALTLGLLGLRRSGIRLGAEAVEGALAKIERVLPEASRARVQALQDRLALDGAGHDDVADSALLVCLSEAAARGQSMRLRYRSVRDEETERVVDPYGVVAAARAWYMVGHCHLRHATRIFRLDRMQSAVPDTAWFDPPSGFDCLDYVLRRVASWGSAHQVEVVLGLSLEEARRKAPRVDTALEIAAEGVILHARATDLDGLARFLLGLCCALTVRRPPELAEALRRAARQIMDRAEHAEIVGAE